MSEPVIDLTHEETEYSVLGPMELKLQRQLNVFGFFIYMLAMVLMFIFAWELILFTGVGSSIVIGYADTLGIIGTIVVLIQFIPQIYLTFSIKVFTYFFCLINFKSLFDYNLMKYII